MYKERRGHTCATCLSRRTCHLHDLVDIEMLHNWTKTGWANWMLLWFHSKFEMFCALMYCKLEHVHPMPPPALVVLHEAFSFLHLSPQFLPAPTRRIYWSHADPLPDIFPHPLLSHLKLATSFHDQVLLRLPLQEGSTPGPEPCQCGACLPLAAFFRMPLFRLLVDAAAAALLTW